MTEVYRSTTVHAMTEPSPQHADAMLWPDEQRGPWLINVNWGEVGGRWECVHFEIRSYRTPGEEWAKALPDRREGTGAAVLTATTWRQIPIGRVIEELRRRRIDENTRWLRSVKRRGAVPEWMVKSGEEALAMWSAPLPKEGAGLEQVAAVYRAAWREGRPPTQAVARHFQLSSSAAAKRVARARAAGLLPATSQGRSGAGS